MPRRPSRVQRYCPRMERSVPAGVKLSLAFVHGYFACEAVASYLIGEGGDGDAGGGEGVAAHVGVGGVGEAC